MVAPRRRRQDDMNTTTPLDREMLRIAAETRETVSDTALLDQATAEFRGGLLAANGDQPITDEFLRGVALGAWQAYARLKSYSPEQGLALSRLASCAEAITTYSQGMRETLAVDVILAGRSE